jgi:hypothetical protein
MGESVGVIDLGELRPVGDDDLLPAPSERVRHTWWRAAAAAVAALLCLGLTAAGPAPAALAGGFTIPLTRAWYVYDQDEIYLVSGPQEITAYSLTDGRTLWRTSLPHQVNYLNLLGGPIAIYDQGNCSILTRLDPATGAVSWTRTGVLVGDPPADGTVRIVHDKEARCDDARGGTQSGEVNVAAVPQVMDVVDAQTGAARLSVAVNGGNQWTFGPAAASLAVWDRHGHFVESDLTTGAVLVRGTIPALVNPVGTLANMMPSVWGFDDLWVVLDPPSLMVGDAAAVVSAYDRHTLAPQWSSKLPAPPADTRQYYGFWSCADRVLCVQLGEKEQAALDVATGERVADPTWAPGPSGPGLKLGRRWMIVSDPASVSGDPPVVLWDTVAQRNAFPSWRLEPFAQSDFDRVLLSQPLGERTEFAIFDGHTGRLHRLGGAAGAYTGCELTARQVICLDNHLVLHVWPVRH